MSDSPNLSLAENLIDLTTAALIRCKSGQILRQTRLSHAERADIEQTLTLFLLRRLPKFNLAQGNRDAFVRMLLSKATVNVLRYYRAAKRSATVVSLEAFMRTESDEPVQPCNRDEPSCGEERTDLTLDVAAVLASLPTELRVIADELRTHSITETAEALGMPRTTLHGRVKEIRAAFEARGLDDYL